MKENGVLWVVYILIAPGGAAVFWMLHGLRRRIERLEREHSRTVRDLAGLLVITELGPDGSAPAPHSTPLRSVTPVELVQNRRGSAAGATADRGQARAKPLSFFEDDL